MRASLKSWLPALVLAACEANVDDDEESEEAAWMLGTWSSEGSSSVTYLDVRPRGELVQTQVGGCGTSEDENVEYRWKAAGSDAIEVTELDGRPWDDSDLPTFLVLRDVCDEPAGNEWLDFVMKDSGEEVFRAERAFIRGERCLEQPPPPDDPDHVESDSCRIVWCDGEPPATLPCLP